MLMIMVLLNFRTLFLFIFLILTAKGSNSEEISRIIEDGLQWRRSQVPSPRGISESHVKKLKEFSSEEILQGYMDYLDNFDQKGKLSNMRAKVGGEVINLLLFHDEIIEDTSSLREQLSREKNPRRFYHLARIASSLSAARKEDFIPEMFNALFRDGRVSREEGEYTTRYAADVSEFAVELIEGALLNRFKTNYTPLSQLDRSKVPYHEDEVDHLANWLIENWPGCENFNFSDRNLLNVSKKPLSAKHLEKAESTVDLEGQSTKEISWPSIVSILLVLGILSF